jgi:dTDP-4-dehydrorhamnose reductase
MHKLLLTGSGGFLGTHFFNQLHKQYNIEGIYNTTQNAAIPQSHKINITNTAHLQQLVLAIQPNIIVHTAAISSIAQCEANTQNSYTINVTASIQLATLAKQVGAQYVFCSSDLVFDGINGNYTETDTPNPINIYAKQKYIAEQKIIEINPNAIIARLPLMIGKNKNGLTGVVAEMQQYDLQHKSMHLFTNEYRTPVLVQDVVEGIKILLQENATGIYHIAGAKKMNRLQIAQYIKQQYNLENIQLIGTNHQQKNITNRPGDVSLNITKIQSLGFVPTYFL